MKKNCQIRHGDREEACFLSVPLRQGVDFVRQRGIPGLELADELGVEAVEAGLGNAWQVERSRCGLLGEVGDDGEAGDITAASAVVVVEVLSMVE
jgi:hypothetical protein